MQRNQSLSRAARLAAIVSVVLVLGGGLAAAKY